MSLPLQQFESILKLYLFYGIDETVQENPGNFYLPPAVSLNNKKPSPATKPISQNPPATGFSESSPRPITTAKPQKKSENSLQTTLYEGCNTLSEIATQFKQALAETRMAQSARHFIHTHGVTDSPDILIILNHPTAEEELDGQAANGKEHDFIRFVLKTCNLSDMSIGYYNLCPYRPAGERSLTDDEIAVCLSPLTQTISRIKPKTTLCLSGFINDSVMDSLNQKMPILPFFICQTPQNLQQSPLLKQKLWRNIVNIKQALNSDNVA